MISDRAGDAGHCPPDRFLSGEKREDKAEQPEADRYGEAAAGVALIDVVQHLAHEPLRAILGKPQSLVEQQPDLGPPVRPRPCLLRLEQQDHGHQQRERAAGLERQHGLEDQPQHHGPDRERAEADGAADRYLSGGLDPVHPILMR